MVPFAEEVVVVVAAAADTPAQDWMDTLTGEGWVSFAAAVLTGDPVDPVMPVLVSCSPSCPDD